MGIHKINHVLSSIMIIHWMVYFAVYFNRSDVMWNSNHIFKHGYN